MKLGFLILDPTQEYGPNVQAKNLLCALSASERIDEITVICQRGKVPSDTWFVNGKLKFRDIITKQTLLSSVARFDRICSDIDLLHLYSGDYRLVYLGALQQRAPLLLGPSFQHSPILTKLLMYITNNNYVFSSHRPLRLAVKNYPIPTDRIAFIPSSVDTSHFSPEQQNRARLEQITEFELNDYVIFWANHLNDHKRPLLALRAFEALRETREDVTFILAGDGDKQAEVTQQIASVEDAHYVGYIDHRNLSTYYATAAVTLLTSKSESFSSVALESLASGTPLVTASDFEQIGRKQYGNYLQADSGSEMISAAIDSVLDTATDTTEMVEHVKQYHSLETRAEKYLSTYEWCLGMADKPTYTVDWEASNLHLFGGGQFR